MYTSSEQIPTFITLPLPPWLNVLGSKMTNFVSVDTDDQRIRYTSGNWAQSDEEGPSSRTTSDQSATVTFDFEGLAHLICVLFTLPCQLRV
jgi:hypothetical protein